MTVSERLKKERVNAGVFQQDLANFIGVTKQTIHKYESGAIKNIPLSRIVKLAKFFNVNPSYLAGWNDKK